MTQLINYNSYEAKILKPIFQLYTIDPFISLIVESFIYKEQTTKFENIEQMKKNT